MFPEFFTLWLIILLGLAIWRKKMFSTRVGGKREDQGEFISKGNRKYFFPISVKFFRYIQVKISWKGKLVIF